MSQELDLEIPYYPLYGNAIIIPENTVFWRGYDPKFPVISDRPSYFGSKFTATGYAKQNGKVLGAFTNKIQLHLLDIRFMKIILSHMFNNTIIKTTEDKNVVMILQTSFGLCSLRHQIKLIKNIYKGNLDKLTGLVELEKIYNDNAAIEQAGVRIAETTIDTFSMGFLKGLFQDTFHGFISPRLESPFHVEKNGTMSPEIILFNPQNSFIYELISLPIGLPKIGINDLIMKGRNRILTFEEKSFKTEFFMRGGSMENSHSLDIIDVKKYNSGLRMGKKWNSKNSNYLYFEPPVPAVNFILNL